MEALLEENKILKEENKILNEKLKQLTEYFWDIYGTAADCYIELDYGSCYACEFPQKNCIECDICGKNACQKCLRLENCDTIEDADDISEVPIDQKQLDDLHQENPKLILFRSDLCGGYYCYDCLENE